MPGNGLQIRARRFDSGRGLERNRKKTAWWRSVGLNPPWRVCNCRQNLCKKQGVTAACARSALFSQRSPDPHDTLGGSSHIEQGRHRCPMVALNFFCRNQVWSYRKFNPAVGTNPGRVTVFLVGPSVSRRNSEVMGGRSAEGGAVLHPVAGRPFFVCCVEPLRDNAQDRAADGLAQNRRGSASESKWNKLLS